MATQQTFQTVSYRPNVLCNVMFTILYSYIKLFEHTINAYTYIAKGDHWTWTSLSYFQCGRRYRSKITVCDHSDDFSPNSLWHQVTCISFVLSNFFFKIQLFESDYDDASSIVPVTITKKYSQKYNNNKCSEIRNNFYNHWCQVKSFTERFVHTDPKQILNSEGAINYTMEH